MAVNPVKNEIDVTGGERFIACDIRCFDVVGDPVEYGVFDKASVCCDSWLTIAHSFENAPKWMEDVMNSICSVEFSTGLANADGFLDENTVTTYRIDWVEGIARLMVIF